MRYSISIRKRRNVLCVHTHVQEQIYVYEVINYDGKATAHLHAPQLGINHSFIILTRQLWISYGVMMFSISTHCELLLCIIINFMIMLIITTVIIIISIMKICSSNIDIRI